MEYTVGDLAKRCGLTVRALHHYEKLGLLKPSGRSEAGYRLYNEADVLRLHRLLAYRHSGLALKQIGVLLEAENPPLLEVLSRHIAEVERNLGRQQRLLRALKSVAERAAQVEARASEAGVSDVGVEEPDVSEHLLATMGMMQRYEKYFNEDDFARLEARRIALGTEALQASEAEWPALIRAVHEEMARGTDPASARVRALVARWQALMAQFTGDDAEVRAKFQTMWANEPLMQRDTGVTPELIAYLRASVASTTTGALPAAKTDQTTRKTK
ncbi:MerR family transcriptional regulator [Paucibacter sp. B2R-40]|uniref:MerR family transcriptional regulator n=1 Tax=Paucibacter sp. B2R-40 TaxID=2893554 RepID=UPI0021E3CD57|nr:MerR family transcriptional regulator [Paucibacter sp. B2R-40]MCV2354623.1 MerR family transcriptional regulator [Paucibacter sp. B2R-40]